MATITKSDARDQEPTVQHAAAHHDQAPGHLESSLKPDEVSADAVQRGQGTTGYEHLPLWATVKKFKIAWLICVCAAFSAGTDGYQLAMNSSIIANKGFVRQFATEKNSAGEPYLASGIISGWSIAQNCAQVFGQTGLGFICARFGRKVGMYTLWVLIMSSVLGETLSRNWIHWLIAKFLAGVGVGGLQTTILGYLSEVAPVNIRGAALMMYSFWWTIGSFCTHVAQQSMSKRDPYNWLTPIYTQWAMIGAMLMIYIFLPESPAWCATKGRTEQGKRMLRKIYHGVQDADVDYQYELICLAIEHERALAIKQRNEKWWAIFKGVDGRRTITAFWCIVAQQFLGLALFGTYGTYFFQQAGLENPFQIKAITSSIQIIVVVLAVLCVDKFGRRLMANCMTTLMWISCLVVGILGVVPETKGTVPVFILFACLWNAGIAANGAAGWGYIGEISSQRLRPYTSGFAASANSIGGVIMQALTPYMVNANQWNWRFKTGFFYAGVGLPWVIGMWLLIPETAGRSAAELDELFERKIKPWRFHKTETATQALLRANLTEKDAKE